MDSKIFNKYKIESDILTEAMKICKTLANEGVKIYDISSTSDTFIKEELNKIYKNLKKGLAMPTCISVNSIVCHYSPNKDDDYTLQHGDIIRIEIACFIENYVSTLGDTIKIGANNFDECDEIKAARLALSTGIKLIEPFMDIKKFDKIIEEIGSLYGLELLGRPYVFNEEEANLEYDWVKRDDHQFLEQSWVVRCDEELDLENLITMEENKYELDSHFNIGDIYHLEVAFTKSKKLASVSDTKASLFQKTYIRYGLKSKYARELCTLVNKNIGDYFFRLEDLEDLEMTYLHAKIGIKEAKRHNVFRELGIIEQKNSDVIRLKCTIAIMENNVYILTGKNNMVNKDVDSKLSPELLKIFKNNIKFSKRDAPTLYDS
jgi:hypothetical protein